MTEGFSSSFGGGFSLQNELVGVSTSGLSQIFNQYRVTLIDVTFRNCSSRILGDAMLAGHAIFGQGAEAFGGGIYGSYVAATLIGILITECSTGPVTNVKQHAAGGGLAVTTGSSMLLTNRSLLRGNTALGGSGWNIWVAEGAVATYRLPAPPGRWVAGVHCNQRYVCKKAFCSESDRELSAYQPCSWDSQPEILDHTVETLGDGEINVDYPYSCSKGLYGVDRISDQSSAACSGPYAARDRTSKTARCILYHVLPAELVGFGSPLAGAPRVTCARRSGLCIPLRVRPATTASSAAPSPAPVRQAGTLFPRT